MSWSNEFKVGIFVLIAAVLAVFGLIWSLDGLKPTDETYTLHLAAPSAEGLYKNSAVRLAGVDIGAIEEIRVEGDRAVIDLGIREEYLFPVDSTAAIRSTGLLGDRFVTIQPGLADEMLKDGDWITLVAPPADYERIAKQVEDITEDVSAITSVLRQMVEDDRNRENVEATLANVEALSAELRLMAEQNRGDINAIVDSVRRLTTTLEGFATDTRSDVDEEMEKLKEATDTLDQAITDIASITGKIDEGEGTIGALVNDRETVDLLNETIENANSVIEGFSGMHTDVYYVGRYYAGIGAPPVDPFFGGNPLAGAGSNTIGLKLQPQEDFWYNFEINDYPTGTITYVEHLFPESGQVYTEYLREPNYRFTFQMNKRWRWYALRLGVKEGGGGLGATTYMFDDRFELQLDVFDFDLGSYPAIEASGLPNLRLAARYEPIDHVHFDVGAEQILLGARYGYGTVFAGLGFHFSDDDIKLLFATLPLDF